MNIMLSTRTKHLDPSKQFTGKENRPVPYLQPLGRLAVATILRTFDGKWKGKEGIKKIPVGYSK
jgi:hypothetical protein